MIIMPVPKDIRNVKAKFIGPFTRRQTYAIVPSGLIAVGIYTLFNKYVSAESLIGLIAAIDTPIIACGFIDVYGMPLWVFAKDVAVTKCLAPKHRLYATENTYAAYARQSCITYEYFDGDMEVYFGKKQKRKKKLNQKRLERFLSDHPELKPVG